MTTDAEREREIRLIAEPGKGYPNDWMEDTHVLLRLLDQARAESAAKDALLERAKAAVPCVIDGANPLSYADTDKCAMFWKAIADYAALRGEK